MDRENVQLCRRLVILELLGDISSHREGYGGVSQARTSSLRARWEYREKKVCESSVHWNLETDEVAAGKGAAETTQRQALRVAP